MISKQIRRTNKLTFLFLLLGLIFFVAQTSYAQRTQREKVRTVSPCELFDDECTPEELKEKRRREAEFRAKNKTATGKNSTKTNTVKKPDDCAGTLKVTISGSPSVVRVGQSYSFVALSTGGCKGTYKYQWSGTNLNTGTGKRTGLLSRNNMSASFKNLGTSTISVAVVDAKNNRASDRITIKVLPRK